MEGAFKNYLIGFIVLALFGMLLLTSVVEMGGIYDEDTSEIVGGATSLDNFNESISSVEENAQALKERFEQRSIWSALVGIVVEGIFGIAKDMIAMIFTPFSVLSSILEDRFQVPTYVTSVIFGLLIFGIIFGIWRLLKIGD